MSAATAGATAADKTGCRTLVIVTGPTGSGKSALAVELAKHFATDVISADSRQIYRGIPIGTATPTPGEMDGVIHHFVSIFDLDRYYSAAQYESDVMELLPQMWRKGNVAVMCGGSMMYVDAVARGIDDIPTVSDRNRRRAMSLYENGGLQRLRLTLLEMDPVYYREADLNNHKRLIHAIEICMEAGVPYSSLRTGKSKTRPFSTVGIAIGWNREDLFDRINRRVDAMIAAGLVDEARAVSGLRHLNSLNTVGYKEMFRYIDGEWDLDTAIQRMAKNTRVYAKKQLTWLKQRPSVAILDPYCGIPLKEQALAVIRSRSMTKIK